MDGEQIGNCVGANNHQHFLLFLLFATASGIYVLTMSIYASCKLWPKLLKFRRVKDLSRLQAAASFNVVLEVLAAMIGSLEPIVSVRAFALIYLCIASLSLMIGVGLLLYQQVQLVYSGETYVGSLSSKHHEQQGSWNNLRKLFGFRHPFLWFLPRFSNANYHASQTTTAKFHAT